MTYDQIKPYIESGLVSEQAHPVNADIKIFNYTQKCQFAREWNDVTKQCRGLIMNTATGEILARPFPKFFNYQEHVAHGWEIPSEIPVITEKLDGSLGILYWIPGDAAPWIATRGSFVSEQAQWATKWFRNNVHSANIPKKWTHLFEIIYPENRIVVSYDFTGLVLISIRSVEYPSTEIELHDTIFKQFCPDMRIAKRIEWQQGGIMKLAELDEPNSEGFVLYYPVAGIRMKIKFPEYVRLHRLVTGISEIAIWEYLRDGKGLDDLLEKVPDEFFKWVTQVENRLRADFATLWGKAQMAVQMIGNEKHTRKEQAIWIMENAKKVSSAVFCLLDGEDQKAVNTIWKMVRPHGRSGFKVDIDL